MNERQFGWRCASAPRIFGPNIYLAALLLTLTSVLSACGGGGGGGGGPGQAEPASTTPDPAPTLSLSASSTSVTVGESVMLTWESSNADSCRASGGWSGDKALSGTETVGPLQETQTFSLSCSGSAGGALREVTISVAEDSGVSVTLSASAQLVVLNGQAELTWSSNNADRCEASGAWSGEQELSGTFTTPPLSENATYKLTCFAAAQSAVALVSVEVSDNTINWIAPTENVDGTPLTDLAGFRVYWGDGPRDYSGSVGLDADARDWVIDLASGTYFLAVTAIDDESTESSYSNEIRKVIP